MKKTILTICMVFMACINFQAQKIEMSKSFGGYTFTQDNKKLSLNDLQGIMKDNQEAFDLVKSAKSNQTWGMILGGAGGALIGIPIGRAIGGSNDPKWVLAGAGAALVAATIPILNGYNKKTKKAVELYNNSLTSNSYRFNPQINLNLKGNGIGITMSF